MAFLKTLAILCLVASSAFCLPGPQREKVGDKDTTTSSPGETTTAGKDVKSQEPQTLDKQQNVKSDENPLEQQSSQVQEKSKQSDISPQIKKSKSESDVSKQQPQQFQGQTQDTSIDSKSFQQPQGQDRQMRSEDQGKQDQIPGQKQDSDQKQILVYSLLQLPRRETSQPCPLQRNVWNRNIPYWQNIYQGQPSSSRPVISSGLSPLFNPRVYYRDLSDELEDLYGLDSSPESDEYYSNRRWYTSPNLWGGSRIFKRDVSQQTPPDSLNIQKPDSLNIQKQQQQQQSQPQQQQQHGSEGFMDSQMKSGHRHGEQQMGSRDEKGPFRQTKPFEAEVNFMFGTDLAHLEMKFPEGRGKYKVHDGRGSVRKAEFFVDNQGNFQLLDKKESQEAPHGKKKLSFKAGNVDIDLTLRSSEGF